MMPTYRAVQRPDGRWVYAVVVGPIEDDHTEPHPIHEKVRRLKPSVNPMGYCAGRRVKHLDPVEAAKFHDDGHATEQEAIDCAMAWAEKRQT